MRISDRVRKIIASDGGVSPETRELLAHMDGWEGEMEMHLTAPTVYHVWIYHFYKVLFADLVADEKSQASLVSNYPFRDFMYRMLDDVLKQGAKSRFQRACSGGKPLGQVNYCRKEILSSFKKAHEMLEADFGKD